MRNTANTSSAAALIPSMAELSKIGDRHSSDSEPVGLNDSERAMSIDDGSRSNQLPGMVSSRTAATLLCHESRETGNKQPASQPLPTSLLFSFTVSLLILQVAISPCDGSIRNCHSLKSQHDDFISAT